MKSLKYFIGDSGHSHVSKRRPQTERAAPEIYVVQSTPSGTKGRFAWSVVPRNVFL